MDAFLPILVALSVFFVPNVAISENSFDIENQIQTTTLSQSHLIVDFCSCIKTARYLGLPLPPTPYAGDLRANTKKPEKGDGVLLTYETDEHIAVILDIVGDNFLIGEGNFRECQYTERLIPFDDIHIRGFIRI